MVQGSGVGVFLHKCLRLNGSKGVGSCMLGSPTRLQDSRSLSESSSFRSQKSPRLCAVMASSVLRPEMEQGFVQRNLCYDLVDLQQ